MPRRGMIDARGESSAASTAAGGAGEMPRGAMNDSAAAASTAGADMPAGAMADDTAPTGGGTGESATTITLPGVWRLTLMRSEG